MANLVDMPLKRHLVERRYRGRQEETDPALENREYLPKSTVDLFARTDYESRVRHTPVSGHRPTWPYRTYLFAALSHTVKTKSR